MAVYWVARSRINDPEPYNKYLATAPGVIEQHGGEVLARGGKYKVLEGTEHYNRFIILKFESFEQAEACFRSEEYQSAAVHRRAGGGGDVEIWLVEAYVQD